MKIFVISLFPQLIEDFSQVSLIKKAQENWLLEFAFLNPRDFCTDKHQQIDDEIYGGGKGMLIKAEPVILAVESIIAQHQREESDFSIVFPSPSQEVFSQKSAYGLSKKEALIFVCGRYEGIDARFEQYFAQKYPQAFRKLSLGQFIVLGGEMPTAVMIEAIVRLIPGVIKEKQSRIEESYAIKDGMQNLEAPNYTRPEEVFGLRVPEVLLSGDINAIEQRRAENSSQI